MVIWQITNVYLINVTNYKCLSCNANYSKKIDENLKNQFKNTFEFSNDINKFILLLRKGVYPCEFMDDYETFNEKPLPEKELSSNLNMEDVTVSDYNQGKRICKDLKIKNWVNVMICILKVTH